MKKKFALFNLFINMSIYKLLAVFLLSATVQAILVGISSKKYYAYGFVRVIFEANLEPVLAVSGLAVLLAVICPFAGKSNVSFRLQTLREKKGSIIISNLLAKLYLLIASYFLETVLLFTFAKIYTMSDSYVNGPQGIVTDFTRSPLLYLFYPYYNWKNVLTIGIVILFLALVCEAVSEPFLFKKAQKQNNSQDEVKGEPKNA